MLHLSEEKLALIAAWRERGERITFTQGVFDLFHSGHDYYLSTAADIGSRLIVGIDSNDKVRSRKGTSRPIESFSKRMASLRRLGYIDLIFKKRIRSGKWGYLKTIQPDYWVVTEQFYDADRFLSARKYVKRAIIVLPRYPDVSTTRLVEALHRKASTR